MEKLTFFQNKGIHQADQGEKMRKRCNELTRFLYFAPKQTLPAETKQSLVLSRYQIYMPEMPTYKRVFRKISKQKLC